ncbi:MAG: gamma-glutamyltransferase, partial [Phycisphaerales bacterium]|nr:gamma-glutamyltransferase [Phycisphaerales bacterium]
NPGQARTLEALAATQGRALYEGALADAISEHARATGGAMTREDLLAHAPEWVTPMDLAYRGVRVHELPPNGQGIAALIALGLLARHDIAGCAIDSAESLHLQIEAMKLAFADAYRYVADPTHMERDGSWLLDDGYLDARAAMIRVGEAHAAAPGPLPRGGTVYLATADAEGRMVSFIQSNFWG